MMTKTKSGPEPESETGAPPKVNHFFRLVDPMIVSMKTAHYFFSNPAHRLTHTDTQTRACVDQPITGLPHAHAFMHYPARGTNCIYANRSSSISTLSLSRPESRNARNLVS